MITIPDGLRSKASNLPQGGRWLAELPDVCRRLSEQWSVEMGAPFDGCHVSFVVAADRGAQPLALKIPLPSTIELGTLPAGARADEAAALRGWAGEGSVQLVEHDPTTEAMLLERCIPGTPLYQLDDPEEADRVAADLLARLHQTRPPAGRFERLSDRAAAMAQDLPERYEAAGAPFDRWLIDTAVDLLDQLARSSTDEVLLHGDFHLDNILSAEREPWLAIDPLPMIGDPAYDTVQYLLFRKGDLADPDTQWADVIARFCERVSVDLERVKAWLFARLVTDALASYIEGTRTLPELEARQSDLWTARLVHRLRE